MIQNKIVVRYRDGHLSKGYTNNFMPNKDVFHIVPLDAPAGATGWTEVRFIDLRFMYNTVLMQGRTDPPIAGTVYVDGSGSVYIADTGNSAIRKIDTSGSITTFISCLLYTSPSPRDCS